MISYSKMNLKETTAYENWRKNHECLSTIEFIIKPDCVGQSIEVRCHKCGEVINITDWESA